MRPVVPVEALAHLRAHICEEEGVIERLLAPFCVRRGYLVPAVVAGAEVVLEFSAEFLRYGRVFNKDGVPSVTIGDSEGFGGDVLCDPRRIS